MQQTQNRRPSLRHPQRSTISSAGWELLTASRYRKFYRKAKQNSWQGPKFSSSGIDEKTTANITKSVLTKNPNLRPSKK